MIHRHRQHQQHTHTSSHARTHIFLSSTLLTCAPAHARGAIPFLGYPRSSASRSPHIPPHARQHCTPHRYRNSPSLATQRHGSRLCTVSSRHAPAAHGPTTLHGASSPSGSTRTSPKRSGSRCLQRAFETEMAVVNVAFNVLAIPAARHSAAARLCAVLLAPMTLAFVDLLQQK
jgi:hypothetical protein